MQSDGGGSLYELSREECLALLPTVPVGRLVFSERALPAVVPVNFALDHGRVVIRTGEGSSLAAALRGEVVGFQVDAFDATARNGWSVLVVGRAAEVRDPTELARLADLPLEPWAGGRREHVLVVPLELVTGRRVGLGVVATRREDAGDGRVDGRTSPAAGPAPLRGSAPSAPVVAS